MLWLRLDNAPALLPLIRTLDELPAAQVKMALTRLAAGKSGRELAEAIAVHGGAALRMELQHPGVGLFFVRGFGDEGVELALENDNRSSNCCCAACG